MPFNDAQVRQLKSSIRRRHVREREVDGSAGSPFRAGFVDGAVRLIRRGSGHRRSTRPVRPATRPAATMRPCD